MRFFLKTKVVKPEVTTSQDLLGDALKQLKIAEIEYAHACDALAHFYATHPKHVPVKRIGDGIWIQITPDDPELRSLTSRENQARNDRAKKMQRWSDLKERHASHESRHVAGVRVSPWPSNSNPNRNWLTPLASNKPLRPLTSHYERAGAIRERTRDPQRGADGRKASTRIGAGSSTRRAAGSTGDSHVYASRESRNKQAVGSRLRTVATMSEREMH
jgi:hypothetical protein